MLEVQEIWIKSLERTHRRCVVKELCWMDRGTASCIWLDLTMAWYIYKYMLNTKFKLWTL